MPANDGDFNENLRHKTELYLVGMGFSVVPVWGPVRRDQFKQAAIAWKDYQRRKPTKQDISRWFPPYGGIAVITGRISQLLVLDFDTDAAYRHFCLNFRHLTEGGRRIKTPRGHHIYLKVPPHVQVASRRTADIDLQYQGCYVVAPPTPGYSVAYGGLPYTVTQQDIDQINAYLDKPVPPVAEPEPVPEETPSAPITLADLAGLYRKLAPQEGRNNALFKVACLARDHGHSEVQALRVLGLAHVRQAPNGQHKPETPDKRRQEAEATLHSAYKHPRRPVTAYKEPEGLPNTVREALLGYKLTCVIRTVEGLRLQGIQPGETFTRDAALARLAGLVGRDSVDAALRAALDGQFLLHRERASSSPPRTAVACRTAHQGNSSCKKSGAKKPGQLPQVYTMPTNRELAERLGVRHSTISDPLTEADLRKASSTRKALHRGFIRRSPGQYPMQFLAKRLGITVRTLQNYHVQDKMIRIAPQFHEKPLFWHNVEQSVMDEYMQPFHFLRDQRGNRYPAKLGIARKLLAKKKRVSLCQQTYNQFWSADAPAPVIAALVAESPPERRFAAPENAISTRKPPRPPANAPPEQLSLPGIDPPRKPQLKPKQPRKVSGKRKLRNPADEALARQIYTALNVLSGSSNQITLKNARKLVVQYDRKLILKTLELTQKRRNIRNPVGFFVTVLRGEAKFRRPSSHF